ncbi:SET domain protein [Cladophialophora carrionii]|uniref:SET domain protein n=1 Tax=Cladophialophora carrionii TaxID=86049 RepID=A0A1C1CUM1_9EURO|nr:SET domain protein [Cladophialophora carrionii]
MPYLSTVHWDSSLTLSQRELIQSALSPKPDAYIVSTQCTFSPTSNPAVVIESIKLPSHPAYPQSGLFAARPLVPGTHIIDYTGLLHSCPLPSCSTSDYDLAFLDRDASLAIDGAGMGNEARFINDYHGIRDGPNAVFEEYYVRVKGAKGKEMWEARMGVWVNPLSSGIAKGEEICLSYGKGYWRARLGAMEQQKEGDCRAGAAAKDEADLSGKVMSMTIEDGNG